MNGFAEIETPIKRELLIAFSDLTGFAAMARKQGDDLGLFGRMSEYFELVGDIIEGAGGQVIKFIGDAVLMVFPADAVDAGVRALAELKKRGDRWWAERGCDCQHVVQAHFGVVAMGYVGTRQDKRLDIFGDSVSVAATLRGGEFTVTREVFERLEAETRKLFRKHTPEQAGAREVWVAAD